MDSSLTPGAERTRRLSETVTTAEPTLIVGCWASLGVPDGAGIAVGAGDRPAAADGEGGAGVAGVAPQDAAISALARKINSVRIVFPSRSPQAVMAEQQRRRT
jgi:hypothetical protein